MSLNMYLGEVQNQTQSMNAVCTATIQGMEQAIQSIDAFAIDTVLQGQTYSSAKSFFVQTFRPLAQGIIYLCEELIRQNDAFPSQFQSQVASTDVIEQEILEQIQEIDRMKTSMEAISQAMPLPGMDAMANLFTAMRHKLQEKLDHLHEFNQTSSNNYSTAIQLAASIATGLAEVQSGKGFSLASGTFSTQGLNMEWTNSIQAITEDRKRQSEEESTIDKSLLDKFKDAVENKIEAMDQLSEKLFHQIENTPLLGQYYNYKKGQNEAVLDELKGILNTVLHPIDSFESAVYALSHIDETFAAVEQAISDSWNQDVVNGDWNSRAKWFGNVEMQVKLAAAQLLVGTKGVDKISKFGKFSRLGETSKLSESVNFIQGIKNVINFDKFKQSVDMLNNILMPKNQVAYAGGNNIRSRFDTPDLRQAKDTFLFFNPFKSHPNSIYKNNRTVEHIFHGNIDRAGDAGGYHHKSIMGEGEVLRVTRPPNRYGVYEAEVSVNGIPKRLPSTFFPDHCGRIEVLKAIEVAYNNKVYSGTGNRYIGTAPNGMKIRLFIASNGRIISAFPLY
ncbi:EndoU domain-containing protein [Bacillus sp. FSL K6-6038]